MASPTARVKLVGKKVCAVEKYDNKPQNVHNFGHPDLEHESRSPGESATDCDHQGKIRPSLVEYGA